MGKLLNCQLLKAGWNDFAQNTTCHRADPGPSREVRGHPRKTSIFAPGDLEGDFGELKIFWISSILPSGRDRVDPDVPKWMQAGWHGSEEQNDTGKRWIWILWDPLEGWIPRHDSD